MAMERAGPHQACGETGWEKKVSLEDDHASDALAHVHQVEALVDLLEREA